MKPGESLSPSLFTFRSHFVAIRRAYYYELIILLVQCIQLWFYPPTRRPGIESSKNLLNSLVCNAYEIRPEKRDRHFSKKSRDLRRFGKNRKRGSGLSRSESGAGDGNRTHVRSLGSFYTAIVRRPLVLFHCTQQLIFRTAVRSFYMLDSHGQDFHACRFIALWRSRLLGRGTWRRPWQ